MWYGLFRLVCFAIAGLIPLGLSASAIRAIRTGTIRVRGGKKYQRAKSPGQFWTNVIGQVAVAAGIAYALIYYAERVPIEFGH